MCYLTIKEMATISEDVIIVTSRWDPSKTRPQPLEQELQLLPLLELLQS